MQALTFGQRFKMLRLEMDFTQDALINDFQEKTGIKITKSAVSNYENNLRVPEIPLLKSFAAYFNVTTDWLLGTSETRDADEALIESVEDPKLKVMFRGMSNLTEDEKDTLLKFAKAMFEKQFKE